MGLPKHLQEKETTRSRSKKQETRIAKELKGRITSNSGATFGENDVITDFCEIEAKTTKNKSFSIKTDEFQKLKGKCKIDKLPIFQIDFETTKDKLVILDYEDFLYLIEQANREED